MSDSPNVRADAGPVVTDQPLPEWVRGVSELDHIDYSDCFFVPSASVARLTTEQWAREVLEHAPWPVRRQLRTGWLSLGLRHGRLGAPDHVLGWPIGHRTEERVVLRASSRIGMPAELVLGRVDDGWLFATLVEHDNRLVAALWSVVVPVHQPTVRRLLGSAARRVTRAG